MKLLFDHRFFAHVNEASSKETGRSSRGLGIAESMLKSSWVAISLAILEAIAGKILALPIPIYSSIVYATVTNMRGLPHFLGMYARAMYYREKLGKMEANVLIDQGVFFAYPKGVELSEFAYIDKNVIIMSRTAKVGRRVHMAPSVFVSGGGEFEIEDYACIATGSKIITSTEVLKGGARCSGPMVSADQRNVYRGMVKIKKDAFIGPNVTLLPGVTVAEGAVAGAGVTIARSTDEWGIYVGGRAERISFREPVVWPDN